MSSHAQFPILEGNVIDEIGRAIRGHDCFVERRSDVDGFSFVSFDYKNASKRAFADPEAATCPLERRMRLLRLECRGLLVDLDTGRVLARRLHKFWNVGERPMSRMNRLPTLDDRCTLLEKMDGSLVTPFVLGGTLNIDDQAARQRLRWATKRIISSDVSDFVKNTCSNALIRFAIHCICRLESTPIFEWIDPTHPIIIQYERRALVLIAIRNITTGKYLPYVNMVALLRQFFSNNTKPSVWIVPRLELNLKRTPTLERVMADVKTWGPNREGAVLRFPNDVLVKIKSDWYLSRNQSEKAELGR